ncbi:MAG: deoxyribodipyrimidine photo-lyase, partial [Rhodopirellula sp. JB044]|uniref:deoxyribodipyrimidine photo-lyase n=1 Tax=Rhodopirellula sp. JB044 TaxID=3342844 RepID=UPI00370CBE26
MSNSHIADQRIQRLNDADCNNDGDYTLYWMQQSQRTECNHALEFAVERANENNNRLLVCFALAADYPDANLRHYQFLLEGLQETAASLADRKIKFALRIGSPTDIVKRLGRDASEVICDRGYLSHQVEWRRSLAGSLGCRVWQIESDAIVPVETASEKQEYAARTI